MSDSLNFWACVDDAKELIEEMGSKYNKLLTERQADQKEKASWNRQKEEYIDVQKMQAKQIDHLRGDNMILQDEKKNLQALLEEAEKRAELAERELRHLKYEMAGGMRR